MAKVGVVLAGCGVMDGSEIHEAVCCLLALEKAGIEYQCMAPDTEQLHVINHLKGEPAGGESRNVLVESARIARGDVVALDKVSVADYDGFLFPGGFGAAKNLCTFAVDGADCKVNPDVERLIKEAHTAKKVMSFVCIAPVIVAKVLGKDNVKAGVTIGDDESTAGAINSMGAHHFECPVKEAYTDEENMIISSPAYMKAQSVAELYAGIESTVKQMARLMG